MVLNKILSIKELKISNLLGIKSILNLEKNSSSKNINR